MSYIKKDVLLTGGLEVSFSIVADCPFHFIGAFPRITKGVLP